MPQTFRFKTKPRRQQLEAFELSREREFFALLMEMGTGKSKVDIDSTAWSGYKGLLDAWLIVAPPGVHLNWIRQELPKHLPDGLNPVFFEWNSQRARNKGYQEHLAKFLQRPKTFPILSMNIEALLTDAGREAASRLLRGRQAKLTVDEGSIIKNPKAQRTKLLLKAGKLAVQRRLLNGTPITNGPLNFYSQCLFLDQSIFGFSSYYAFAHHYAEWKKQRNWGQGRDYEELVSYKNLDELIARVAPHSYRVLKADCLDLPPKIKMPPLYFELSPEQERLYAQLENELFVVLETGALTAPLAITRLLRLQQLTCGYLPTDESGGKLQKLPGPNPRLEALKAYVEELEPKKMLIWARFQEDIRLVTAALRQAYGERAVVVYDGTVKTQDAKDAAKVSFQDPASPVRFFVGNPAAGGRGLDLYAAEAVVYYSNSFSLEQRLQSEDRAHRDGLTHPVTYVDLAAVGTIDEHISETLQNGEELAAGILRRLPQWRQKEK